MSDQSQYIIDIAAQMKGGEYTNEQLTTLTEGLIGGGRSAEAFQSAVVKVANQLDAARVASTAANSALAAGSQEYRTLESAALQSAKAAERAALKNAGVIPAELKVKAELASAAVNAYAANLTGLEKTAQEATAKQDALGTALKNVKKLEEYSTGSLKDQHKELRHLGMGLKETGGELGKFGSEIVAPVKGFNALSQVMGQSGAITAVAGMGVGVLALGVAELTKKVIESVIEIEKWAIELGNARRDLGLTNQAFDALDPSIENLSGGFRQLSIDSGQSQDSIRKIADSLIKGKVAAADMPAALHAAAMAETALGKGGSKVFLEQMKASKKSVTAFSAEIESKFGGIVKQKLLGIDQQTEIFHDRISELFGTLNIDPALAGLQTLIGLFAEGSASAEALKVLFSAVFQPLIDNTQRAAYVVEAFALGFEIGMVKLYILLKPILKAAGDLFGMSDTSFESMLQGVTKAAEYLAPVVAVVVVAVGTLAAIIATVVSAAIVGLSATLTALAAPFIAIGAAITYVCALFNDFWGTLAATKAAIASFIAPFVDIGRQIILGLVSGITGAAGAVADAVSGAVHGAISGAKKLLGIASPSKVFAQMGAFTGEGFVQGVNMQAPAANDALANMVEPPQSALSKIDALSGNASGAPVAQSAQQAGKKQQASGAAVDLRGATLNFYGVKDGPEGVDRFCQMLTLALEGDVAQLGQAVAA